MENLSYLISFISVTALLMLVHKPYLVDAQNQSQDDIMPIADVQTRTADEAFVTAAAQSGLAEVELGKLGLRKGSTEAVKTFAQQMVGDHMKANERLKAVAVKNRLALPNTLASGDQTAIQQLASLSGAEFDREFMKVMLKDHQKVVSLFEQQANSGQNPELKEFARSTLPTLRNHLEHARNVEQKVEPRTSTREQSPALGTLRSAIVESENATTFQATELL